MVADNNKERKNFYFFALSRADFWLVYPLAKEFSRKQLGETTLIVSSLVESDLTPESIPTLRVHRILNFPDLGNPDPLEIFSALVQELGRNFKFQSNSRAFLLGDRFETVGISMILNLQNIPYAHISGGESTPHSQDDRYRKCISILASLHFPPLSEHGEALKKMGIIEDDVYEVGYLGWDSADASNLLSKKYQELTNSFKCILFTYHSNSMDSTLILKEIAILEESLKLILQECPTAYVIITASNHDHGGHLINDAFKTWTTHNPRSHFIEQLGEQYLEVMRKCRLVLGNSSSGIVEAPRVGTKTLNIGMRQNGRSNSPLITHAAMDAKEISSKTLLLLEAKDDLPPMKRLSRQPLVRDKIIDRLIERLQNGRF
jgi:UDP-hydrolysing UDP-N-acetyl-D-glucosamine 2-epimerase